MEVILKYTVVPGERGSQNKRVSKQNKKRLPPITANRKDLYRKDRTTLDMLEIGETSSAGPDAQYKLAPEPWVTDTELWNLSAPSHVALVRPCLTFG